MRLITLAAEPLEIQATEATQPATFSGLAYSGGVMAIEGWGDILIASGGLDVPDPVPILIDHENKIGAVAGRGRVVIENGRVQVQGVITRGTPAGDQVISLSRDGVPLQMSVGVKPTEIEKIGPGKKVMANGREHVAGAKGLTFTKAGKLKEITITPLGADASTFVHIAAKHGGSMELIDDKTMQQLERETDLVRGSIDQGQLTKWRNAVIEGTMTLQEFRGNAADATFLAREIKLRRTCNGRPEILAKAMEEGWTIERAELEVLRASRPKPFTNYEPEEIPGQPGMGNSGLPLLEAAMLTRAGHSQIVAETYGERALNSLRGLERASMPDLLAKSLQHAGEYVPPDRSDMIRAALSNHNISVALSNVGHLSVLAGYRELARSFKEFAAVKSAEDFKEHTAIRPHEGFKLVPVAKGGEMQHGTMGEDGYTFKVDTFGKVFELDRKDIINDSQQVFAEVAPLMGRAAARMELDVFYTLMLANVGTYFASDRGNYAEGSGTALSVASLGAGLTAMRKQTDSDGNAIDIQPSILLVPPELETTAKVVLESEFISQTTANVGTANPVRKAVRVIVEPRLSNTKFTGNSALAWYLTGVPSDVAFIVSYLNGKENPTIDFFGLDHDAQKLCVSWRVFHDFGAALGDYRAAYRAKGQA